MSNERFRTESIQDITLPFIVDNESARKDGKKTHFKAYYTHNKSKCDELTKLLNHYDEENKKLKNLIEEMSLYDDEDLNETEYINSVYKKEGFKGVIEYARNQLLEYGSVDEVEKGLWVMCTGGWSDHESWLHCLNNPISLFYRKHYCAYTCGGAFYYTEEAYKRIEIVLKK